MTVKVVVSNQTLLGCASRLAKYSYILQKRLPGFFPGDTDLVTYSKVGSNWVTSGMNTVDALQKLLEAWGLLSPFPWDQSEASFIMHD